MNSDLSYQNVLTNLVLQNESFDKQNLFISLYINSEGHFIAKFMQHELNNHFTLCNDRKKKLHTT